jgi:very-short-patch-repair endonuclease
VNEDLQHVDLHRRNQLELAGYSVLTYSGRLLKRQPDQFVSDVKVLLRRCGCPL